ncbi:hypothetical protein TraAM80_04619 [Trypanosoma rangeli]|uniref:Gamma tubulin complex component protein N-terminal domain-containing protein n=1 Tax=Trypanosoma rangeli TaxID=5698 RepID=A0A3R7KNQ0_TRYRA|nr:uncharacterized protein TraAM80_04619 [Trypanosoma rangeli]RNF05409.1 hypothetical protein TraAM80_04619 [Trypanosoma rangeli]|eukprot:RNF05409.1 hypothetical protein TraAM80_04619 [Trypanosoma rangeli]
MSEVVVLAASAATSVSRAAVDDGNGALSLVELLVELSSSLAVNSSLKYRHGDHRAIGVEPDDNWRSAATYCPREVTVVRRKRRREVLNTFFDSSTASRTKPVFSTSSVVFRHQMRQLFQNAKQNIRQVTETHAALLGLLCSAVVPDIESEEASQGVTVSAEVSEATLMLYIILRTSIAASPNWQKPPVIPRCWLSPSITEMMERSSALQKTMRWSCDADPVVEAALGVDYTRYSRFAFEPYMSYHVPELRTYHTGPAGAATTKLLGATNKAERYLFITNTSDTDAACDDPHYWHTEEKEDVRCLFTRKRLNNLESERGPYSSPHAAQRDPSVVYAPLQLGGKTAKSFCSIFREEYPENSPFCSLLFVALHRGIVGQQDPYLLLRLESGGRASSPLGTTSFSSKLSFSQFGETAESSSSAFPLSIGISPEFLGAAAGKDNGEAMLGKGVNRAALDEQGGVETKDTQCVRGIIAMLQWSCQSGTLFLRLRQLCDVSERPEWRAALGQYGKSAIEALRWLLLSLQRLVAEMGDRAGGPHSVSFRELLVAQKRLRHIAEDITALSDVLFVHAGTDWEASQVLRELSSATLLTSLYRYYAQRTVNNQWRDQRLTVAGVTDSPVRRLDIIGELFLAVLRPLHRMMGAWLCAGELKDPYDEFFVLPSHGTTACGFLVDTSAQRLPGFISSETAERILHAGVSLRVLRAAARHVILCATNEQARLRSQAEDVDAAALHQEQMNDVSDINWLLRDFMESLLGYRSSLMFVEMPEVSLLTQQGSLSHWKAFYGACNNVLLSVGSEMESESKNDATFEPIGLVHVFPINSVVGDDVKRSACTGGGGLVGGKPKSLMTSLSRLSKATTAWHDTVCEELTQCANTMSREEAAAKTKERAALRLAYEIKILQRNSRRKLQQWKAQRLSLNMERAAVLSRSVDELLELYARVLGQPSTTERQEEEEAKDDGRQTPIGRFVAPLTKLTSPTRAAERSVTTTQGKATLSFAAPVFLNKEETPCETLTVAVPRTTVPPFRRGSSSMWMSTLSLSLFSGQKSFPWKEEQPREEAPTSEMYAVAHINDEDYLMKRAGPQVSDAGTREAMLDQFEAAESRIQGYVVSSEVYQQTCREAAIKLLQDEDSNGDRTTDNNECIREHWWTNPTADEGNLFGPQGISLTLTEALQAPHTLTEEHAKRLLHCSSYYLTLSSYTASYLTHKALQVMLLGPYGTLYRLTQQFLDVCLMQSGRVADRMTGLWQRLTKSAIEENNFSASAFMAMLNAAFVDEWESCVLHGRDTLQVQLALTVQNDANVGIDVFSVANEEEEGSGAGGSILFQDTAFRSRTFDPVTTQMVEEAGQEEHKDDAEKGQVREEAIALPDNPFDFISQLTMIYSTPCEGFWLLPKNAVAVYGDLFSTLLFWTSVTQLVTRVWRVGIKSGVPEAFFFCNISRTVLSAVAQYMWFLIAGFVREYRHTLRFESGVLYSYCQLERFTTDHAAFLEKCRFAAMLTPAFARARRQVYGMVRQLEEVEQCLLRASEENATDAAMACSVSIDGRDSKATHTASTHTASSITTALSSDFGSKRTKGKKRTRAPGGETEVSGGGGSAAHGPRIRRKPSQSLASTSSPSDVSPNFQRNSCGSLKERRQQCLEDDVARRVEARRRSVRDQVRRRLRSFAGLTEIFVEHLTAVRDNAAEEAESPFLSQDDDLVEQVSPRSATRKTTSTSALSSLIRTLEMVQSAVYVKL